MRKKSLALTLMLAFSCILGGGDLMGQETVTIGDGTYGSYWMPFAMFPRYYFGETIYTADRMKQSENKTITSIAFNYLGNSNFNEDSFGIDIYMKNTDQSSFSSGSNWVLMSEDDRVFSSTVTLPSSNGWFTIELDDEFEYDYTKNLVIAINKTTNNGDGSYTAGYAFNTTSGLSTYQTVYISQSTDTSPYNPASPGSGTRYQTLSNIKITFKDESSFPVPANLTASPIKTHEATLTWDEAEDAISYNVKYHETPEGEWTTETGLTTNILALSNMDAETEYETQVQAVYSEGNSEWSSSYSFTTLPLKENKYDKNNWGSAYNWNSGIPTVNHDVLISQNIYVNVAAAANNITITAGKTMTIQNGYSLTCNHITNNGTLVIEDGGQLILPTTSTGVQATVKKETYAATPKDAESYYWFAISSAVANPNISSATNIASETYDLYRYNEEKNAELPWENYKNTAYSSTFTTLEPGRGYLYRNASDLSIAMTGEINVADFNYSVTNSGGPLAGFNLIGNPYSHDIYKGAGTAIPNGTDFLRTGFYYMDPTTGKWTAGTDNSTAIKPNQGILVQTDANGSIEMTNTNSNGSSKSNNDNIMFKVANSQYSDEAYAWFDKGRGLNKISHRNAEVPMLYINQDGENYAIATMSDDIKTFSLNFKAMTMGKYTLSYKTKGEFNYLHVIDRFTGEDVDMLLEGEYSFVASPNDSDARFIVRLEYTSNNGTNDSSVFAYQSGNEIIVSGEGELQIFDVMGRKISTHQINGVETVNVNAHGVYIFKLNEKTQKIIIK